MSEFKIIKTIFRLCSPIRRIFGSFTYYDSYLVTDHTQRVKIHMYLPDHTQRVYDHITFRSHREFIKINLPTHTQRVINKITSRSQVESYKQKYFRSHAEGTRRDSPKAHGHTGNRSMALRIRCILIHGF